MNLHFRPATPEENKSMKKSIIRNQRYEIYEMLMEYGISDFCSDKVARKVKGKEAKLVYQLILCLQANKESFNLLNAMIQGRITNESEVIYDVRDFNKNCMNMSADLLESIYGDNE